MQLNFAMGGGSVAGRDHRKGTPCNRQDAYHFREIPQGLVAVVADGCGSSLASEVGAAVAVRIATTELCQLLSGGYPPDAPLLDRMRQTLLSQMYLLARNMGQSLGEVVSNYFLFTLLGVVITDETAMFFALGDGVMIVNGERQMFDMGPGEAANQPLYLGYALTGSTLTDGNPALLNFQIVAELPTAHLDHFLIGTDGVQDILDKSTRRLPGSTDLVGPISRFWEQDKYLVPGSPAITNRLNLMARDWRGDGGLLPDDTTLVVGRRQQIHSEEE